ncbi:MAG: hypothetical protein Q9217_001276 [Psora testacea]
MTDNQRSQTHEVLSSILQGLQRIEVKLDGHEERLRRYENVMAVGSTLSHSTEKPDQNTDEYTGVGKGKGRDEEHDHALGPELKSFDRASTLLKVGYSEWGVDHFIRSLPENVYVEWNTSPHIDIGGHSSLEGFFDLRLSNAIEGRLGDCWNMPDDNRIALKFFKVNILKSSIPGGTRVGSLYRAKQHFERHLDFLCDFDKELRKQRGNDFVVLDFDAFNSTRIYRLGEKAIGPELMVDFKEQPDGPWSRIILYQGATTGGSISPKRKRPEQPIPYFTRTNSLVGVWDHISFHLQLKQRSITTNPYRTSPWTGFHTTFYEICEEARTLEKELWKHGPLYDHPLGWHFRKCAYTVSDDDFTRSVLN